MAIPPRILIVEDEASLLDLLAARFEKQGFIVGKCDNSTAALKMAHDSRPGLILLDILLPNGDGETLLKNLRQGEQTKDIPIVILTNLSDEDLKQRCLALGATDYLIKADYGLDQMVAKIKELYGLHVKERQ